MENIYSDCDRCKKSVQLNPEVVNHVNYKNAFLCLQCASIRSFDDDNPIMYPLTTSQ